MPDPIHQPLDDTAARQRRRGAWLHHVTQWHWMSSAVCLVGLLLFAVTGITLNHAGQIEATPHTLTHQADLRPATIEGLRGRATQTEAGPLPATVRRELEARWNLRLPATDAEWTPDEIYLDLPRPGGDGWLAIDLHSGEALYEQTNRGWIAYFNDLHKGRDTGAVWRWFIDVFAAACVVFSATGVVLLLLHGNRRRITWPTVGLGLVLPLLIALLFIH